MTVNATSSAVMGCPSLHSKPGLRATLLTVSRKGRRLVRKYEEHRAARLAPVLAEFKAAEIQRFTKLISPGGYLMVGHSESLNGLAHDLKYVQPAVYRK